MIERAAPIGTGVQMAVDNSLAERHKALFSLSEHLILNPDPEELLNILASELSRVIEFHYLGVGVQCESKHEFCLRTFDEFGSRKQLPELTPQETAIWQVYQEQQPLVIPFLDREMRFPAAQQVFRESGIRSVFVYFR
jgi:hypothetical protein